MFFSFNSFLYILKRLSRDGDDFLTDLIDRGTRPPQDGTYPDFMGEEC